MFGHRNPTGLTAGELRHQQSYDDAFDELVHGLTIEALDDDSAPADRSRLPAGFDLVPPGPILSVILAQVDRSQLNGYDLVRTMQAHERHVSHHQACSMADAVEIAYSAPGNAESPAERVQEAAEFASDEIRAALTMTRRAADNRLGWGMDLRERLPRVWGMLDEGLIDLTRAQVIVRGVSHLPDTEARAIVALVAERAPRLTTGQLTAWIRRLCVENEPDDASKRYDRAVEERRLWIEQTEDGTGNVHLLGLAVDDARAIGRRVNGYMISLQKKGNDRTHDQLRADIARDMLLGSDPTLGGRGLVDIKVDLTTLAGLDDRAAEIPGMGPVIADVARKVADRQEKAEWRVTATDENGEIVGIVTTSRRPSRALSRYTESTQPTCSFSGCRMPASDCDWDHFDPWSKGGKTSSGNGGPKCRHDDILKDHGWDHQRVNGVDVWTSPMGHTYTSERPP